MATVSEFEAYKEFRSEISYEANLISQRIGWFITAQSILFVALVVSSNREEGVITTFAGGILFPELAFVAFFLGLLTIKAIYESYKRASKYRKKISDLLSNSQDHRLRSLTTERTGKSLLFGKLFTNMIPISFLTIWAIILWGNVSLSCPLTGFLPCEFC